LGGPRKGKKKLLTKRAKSQIKRVVQTKKGGSNATTDSLSIRETRHQERKEDNKIFLWEKGENRESSNFKLTNVGGLGITG